MQVLKMALFLTVLVFTHIFIFYLINMIYVHENIKLIHQNNLSVSPSFDLCFCLFNMI